MKYNLLFTSLALIASANYATETINLKRGKSYLIKLESNPTTGYMWELTGLEHVNNVQIEELHFKAPNPHLIGSGGVQSWNITGYCKGSTRLTFEYKQPWESHSEKTEVFDFVIE